MRKKVKQLFRKKQFTNQNNQKHTASPVNVDICNVNIVSEAEKIIEEYVCKMGYKFTPPKASKTPMLLGIFAVGCALVLFCTLAAKLLLV